MGRITAKNVPVEQAMDYVLGFTCVNDVTLRDLQGLESRRGRVRRVLTRRARWVRRIVTRDDVDWKDANISFTPQRLKDVPMASGTTANLIHGIPQQCGDAQFHHVAAWVM